MTPMDIITYKGKEYKSRIFEVHVLGHNHDATYRVAEESLLDALSKNGECEEYQEIGTEGYAIDSQIYHYVESKVLELDADEICSKHLDIPMKLLFEVDY